MDGCKLRPEAATRSDILYLFGRGNINFIREKAGMMFVETTKGSIRNRIDTSAWLVYVRLLITAARVIPWS